MDNEYLIIFCTVPDEDSAVMISNKLVSEKLAACCNIIRGIRSIYFWEDKVCDDSELLLVIKTKKAVYEKLEERVINLHPYSVPEILAFPIQQGHDNYLKWIDAHVR